MDTRNENFNILILKVKLTTVLTRIYLETGLFTVETCDSWKANIHKNKMTRVGQASMYWLTYLTTLKWPLRYVSWCQLGCEISCLVVKNFVTLVPIFSLTLWQYKMDIFWQLQFVNLYIVPIFCRLSITSTVRGHFYIT